MLSVDRIEEGIAICIDEDGNEIKIKNKGFHEGDVLKKIGKNFIADKVETDKKREKIFNLQESLFDE